MKIQEIIWNKTISSIQRKNILIKLTGINMLNAKGTILKKIND